MRELLLIPLFFLCAWIMRCFVKLVDSFIVNTIIPEPIQKCREAEEQESLAEECPETAQEDLGFAFGRGFSVSRLFKELLDKWNRKSKVMHNSRGYTVQIGTAHPTQVRIRHYE